MTGFDYLINILEAMTTAYIAINYARLRKNIHKGKAFLLMTIISFTTTTFFNLILGYESFYFIVISISQLICLFIISENTLIENIIEILLLSLILSFSVISFIFPMLIFTEYEIYMLYEPPLFTIFCICGRIFHFVWGYLLIKFQKRIGYMITNYNRIFLILLLIIYFGTISVENIMMGNNGLNSIFAFIAEVCFILEIIVILYFMYVTRKKYILDLEKDKLLTIHSTIEEQINQFKQDQERITLLRHDMKNKLLVLDAYLEQNNIEMVKSKIQEDLNYVDSLKAPVFSGNPNLDLLINSKMIKCKNQNILLSIQIDQTAIADIDDISYGILIGNALDNAIEHNRKENPFIELSIMKNQNQVKIEITNPTNQEKLESLETTKTDKSSHGYGTKSIRLVVEEKKGKVQFQSSDHLFTCTIFLPLKPTPITAKSHS